MTFCTSLWHGSIVTYASRRQIDPVATQFDPVATALAATAGSAQLRFAHIPSVCVYLPSRSETRDSTQTRPSTNMEAYAFVPHKYNDF